MLYVSDYDPKHFVAENEEYDLPDDIYSTKGLFDDGQEGKQDDEGLLYAEPLLYGQEIARKYLHLPAESTSCLFLALYMLDRNCQEALAISSKIF